MSNYVILKNNLNLSHAQIDNLTSQCDIRHKSGYMIFLEKQDRRLNTVIIVETIIIKRRDKADFKTMIIKK